MEETSIENHTKHSLELIFTEADKLSTHFLNSIKSNTSRSFFLIGIYISIITYSFFEILKYNFEYVLLLIGGVISLFVLFKNIIPDEISFRGVYPDAMLSSYFTDFKGVKLEIEVVNVLIRKYNKDIKGNKILINIMTNRYLKSIKIMAISFIVFSIVSLFFFIKCF